MKKQLLTIVALFAIAVTYAQHTQPIRTLEIPCANGVLMEMDMDDAEAVYSAEQTTTKFAGTGSPGNDFDFTFTFKLAYDADYLYFFGKIIDDVDHSLPEGESADPHNYDNMELFIDLDTNGSGILKGYDSNTVQLRINRGVDTITKPCKDNYTVPVDIHDFSWENTSDGWVTETAWSWKVVLGDAQLPEDIMAYFLVPAGFDASGADSDASGTPGVRDCQTGWDMDSPDPDAPTGDEDLAWNDRQKFGIVTFAPWVSGVNDFVASASTVAYPNPTTSILNFKSEVTSVKIMNLAGQVVLSRDVNSNMIDLSSLQTGVYIANIDGDFVRVIKN